MEHCNPFARFAGLASRGGARIVRAWMRGASLCPLVGLVLVLTLPDAAAGTVQGLNSRAQPVDLQDSGDYWIDTSGQFTPEQVASSSEIAWKPTRTDAVYPVRSGDSVWVRFSAMPPSGSGAWFVQIANPSIDRISLYTPGGAGNWQEGRAGDLVAVSQWPAPHRFPLLPIAGTAQGPTQYLLRLENGYPFSAALQLVSESHLNYSTQRLSLILGMFFGLIGLTAVVCALGAALLRDTAYGLYALSVTLTGLALASVTGIGGLHLWPDWPWWNDLSTTILPMLTVSASLLCISHAVSLPERSRGLHWLMVGQAALGVVVAATLALLPAASRMTLFLPALLLLVLGGTAGLAGAWRRGDRIALWLILAYLPISAAGGWSLARDAEWVSPGFFTDYGMLLGVALNLPMVMLVLMLRSQRRRATMRRVHAMERIDPATGLINAQVFAERLSGMIARSGRMRQQGIVLLIDLVNSEQVQRDFGRKVADGLPLHMAKQLMSVARDIDSVARLSTWRFGMLVEGPLSAADAAALGPRIVARCLMYREAMSGHCTAQAHVAYTIVPYKGLNAHELMAQLGRRLADTPADSKRAVFILADGSDGGASASRHSPLGKSA